MSQYASSARTIPLGVVPRVAVQGVAEHRAQGPPLQPDDGVGEGGVPGFDLPGQPPAERGAGGAQGLLARLPLLVVAGGVLGVPSGGEVAGQGRVDPVHARAEAGEQPDPGGVLQHRRPLLLADAGEPARHPLDGGEEPSGGPRRRRRGTG